MFSATVSSSSSPSDCGRSASSVQRAASVRPGRRARSTRARVGQLAPGDEREQRRLARPGATGDGDDLPRRDLEVDAVQHRPGAGRDRRSDLRRPSCTGRSGRAAGSSAAVTACQPVPSRRCTTWSAAATTAGSWDVATNVAPRSTRPRIASTRAAPPLRRARRSARRPATASASRSPPRRTRPAAARRPDSWAGSSSLRSASPTVASRPAAPSGRPHAAGPPAPPARPPEVRRQVVRGVLEHDAHRPSTQPAQRARPHPGELAPSTTTRARRRPVQPGQHPQQRRLARTRRPGDHREAPRSNSASTSTSARGRPGGRAVVDADAAARDAGSGQRSVRPGTEHLHRIVAVGAPLGDEGGDGHDDHDAAAAEPAIAATASAATGRAGSRARGRSAVGQPRTGQRRDEPEPAADDDAGQRARRGARGGAAGGSGPSAGRTRSRAPGRAAGRRGRRRRRRSRARRPPTERPHEPERPRHGQEREPVGDLVDVARPSDAPRRPQQPAAPVPVAADPDLGAVAADAEAREDRARRRTTVGLTRFIPGNAVTWATGSNVSSRRSAARRWPPRRARRPSRPTTTAGHASTGAARQPAQISSSDVGRRGVPERDVRERRRVDGQHRDAPRVAAPPRSIHTIPMKCTVEARSAAPAGRRQP